MLPRQAISAGETVIVVGAGTAGAAAAVGLAERGTLQWVGGWVGG